MNATFRYLFLGLLFLIPSVSSASSVYNYMLLSTTTAGTNWGATGGTQVRYYAQEITPPINWYVDWFETRITLVNDIADVRRLRWDLYQGGSEPQEGTLLGTWYNEISEMSSSTSLAVRAQTGGIYMSAGLTYFIVISADDPGANRPFAEHIRSESSEFSYSKGWVYVGVNGGWDFAPNFSYVDYEIGISVGYEDDVGNQTGNRITVFTYPYQGQITPTGNVIVQFSYFINSLLGDYDKAGIDIQNITDGQSVDTSSIEDDIISSGTSNYSDSIVLPVGKMYMGRPYLRSTMGSSTKVVGDWHVFYTVSNPNPYTALPTLNVGAATTTKVGTTTVGTGVGGIGTTTLTFINPASILPNAIEQMFRTKFPFSYMYDGFVLIQELANGTGTTSKIKVDWWTGTTTRELVILDPSTSGTGTSSAMVSAVRTAVEMSLYFVTGLALIGVIMGAL